MRALDNNGRIGIPKEIRERNGYVADTQFEVYENSKGEIVLAPIIKRYMLTDNGMKILRKIYLADKELGYLDESLLAEFKEMCQFTDTKCPECGEYLYLTADNSYKCFKCENKESD